MYHIWTFICYHSYHYLSGTTSTNIITSADNHNHYHFKLSTSSFFYYNIVLLHFQTCQEGFLLPNCNPPCLPKSNPRDGHYTCDRINNKKCLMWWYGHDCQTYCVPHNDAINGHYTCDPSGQKQCILGWAGVKCTTPCFLDGIDDDDCNQYKKLCNSGSILSLCNQCLPGYYGNNCTLTCLQHNSTNAGNIICNSDGKGNCGKWWTGKNCDAYCVPHDDDVNGHYICDMNGIKRCLVGWQSPDCKTTYSLFSAPQ